jgi:agmatinase
MINTSCFGGSEALCKLEDAGIVILPVPYDETSTWIKGADKGPAAIMEASANMELYDIETDSQVFLKGIFTDRPVRCKESPENMSKQVEQRVCGHIENGKFTVVIGGEHSVSIGAIAAHNKRYKNMSVLQLDAHSDLRDEYHNSKFNHACVMAQAKQLCPVVQVGIRSMDISEKKNMDRRNVFFAEDIYDDTKWFDKAIERLTEKVYITIDLDVFDPSIMPSTGTPEPGGLGWYSVLAFLKKVCKKREVIGFDVVELCPNPANQGPDFTAAKLIYKLLSYKFRD